ncbi:hypothetical protein E2C01_040750 [Portunus trituberculatus]|uniref:Uncharacterized protein n=1 Tax=Portunus trituberculatus TaxID=210409 RepID=A0A5B7FNA7_PORTR|nr:hypothetical protein [Portunus trituberculatus]
MQRRSGVTATRDTAGTDVAPPDDTDGSLSAAPCPELLRRQPRRSKGVQDLREARKTPGSGVEPHRRTAEGSGWD